MFGRGAGEAHPLVKIGLNNTMPGASLLVEMQ